MRTLMACMVALWAVGGWGSAYAGTPGPGAAALDDQVTVTGEAHDTPRVMTQGAAVPLRAALREMVPVTYSINLPNAGAWAATPVTWGAGHSLAQTLREMLASHPELAAQVDTDFQLVTVRYRQPFGSDTVGALMPPVEPAPAQSPMPLPSGAAAEAAPASGVVVGGPLGVGLSSDKPPQRAPLTVGKTGPTGLAPRLTSRQFASGGAPAVVDPATQAERAPNADSPRGAAPSTRIDTSGGAAISPASVAAASAPLAASVPALAPAAPPVQTWSIELSDRTVRGALTRWSQEAGWRLIWEAPVDFAVDAPATLTGTFDDALQSVISALSGTDAPVQAILYRGNKVLRIVEKGAG